MGVREAVVRVVALHRRQLPIVSPCDGFEGREATDREPAFCTRCAKPVHDLSRLTEREVVGLLARHVGGELCLSYRTHEDGAIVTRAAPPSRLAPAALAASLAGCAGHLGESDSHARDCIDDDGYRVDCPPTPRLDQPQIPDAIEEAGFAPETIDVAVPAGPSPITVTGGAHGWTVGVHVVEAVAVPPPEPRTVDVAESRYRQRGTIRGGISYDAIEARLSRRAAREARRIERRERRRARRETSKRTARR